MDEIGKTVDKMAQSNKVNKVVRALSYKGLLLSIPLLNHYRVVVKKGPCYLYGN